MSFDSDIALYGTGVAPLIAAHYLETHGKNVLVLNPDWDFFKENSELSVDPMWSTDSQNISLKSLLKNDPETVWRELRAVFPGAVEFWSPQDQVKKRTDFHDEHAPHVRSRARLWTYSELKSANLDYQKQWEKLEDLYLASVDAGIGARVLDGVTAVKDFPGFKGSFNDDQRSVWMPRFADVDVSRYRNGLLEYVRERLGPQKVITGVHNPELMPGGIRFRSGASRQSTVSTAKLKEGLIVFWTPQITHWVQSLMESRVDRKLRNQFTPKYIRNWEEWLITSKEPIEPSTMGVFEDLLVWPHVEGLPDSKADRRFLLSVLRPGSQVELDRFTVPERGKDWASGESFAELSRLFHGFMKWEYFSISAFTPRALFEWNVLEEVKESLILPVHHESVQTRIVAGSDGPLMDILRNAKRAVQDFI